MEPRKYWREKRRSERFVRASSQPNPGHVAFWIPYGALVTPWTPENCDRRFGLSVPRTLSEFRSLFEGGVGHPMEGWTPHGRSRLGTSWWTKNLCSASESVSEHEKTGLGPVFAVSSQTVAHVLEFCHYFAQLRKARRLSKPTFETLNASERTDYVLPQLRLQPFGGTKDQPWRHGCL